MDDSVLRAMAKWPDVPSVYGWLSLDRRGNWLVRGERIPHRVARNSIGRNYAGDERGCWYFQNGPQRVYVELEYTPWILALDGAGVLRSHTGIAVDRLEGVWLDDSGSLLLLTDSGISLLDDRDLDAFSQRLQLVGGDADPDRLERSVAHTQEGRSGSLVLVWRGKQIAVGSIRRDEVAARFGFIPTPQE